MRWREIFLRFQTHRWLERDVLHRYLMRRRPRSRRSAVILPIRSIGTADWLADGAMKRRDISSRQSAVGNRQSAIEEHVLVRRNANPNLHVQVQISHKDTKTRNSIAAAKQDSLAETPPLRVRGRQRSREEMQHRGNRQQAVWDFVLPPGLENMNMENKIKNSIDAATVIGVEREVPNLPMDPVGEPDGIVAEAEGETTAQRSLIIGVTYHYTYEGSELLKM